MINDDEIDLTEHRDFGRNIRRIVSLQNGEVIFSNMPDIIERVAHKQIYGSVPWNVTPIYDLLHYDFDGLVALGNKKQRRDVIKMRYWGTLDNVCCDCCGKQYKKVPWVQDWGICKNCEEYNRTHRNIEFPWAVERIGISEI